MKKSLFLSFLILFTVLHGQAYADSKKVSSSKKIGESRFFAVCNVKINQKTWNGRWISHETSIKLGGSNKYDWSCKSKGIKLTDLSYTHECTLTSKEENDLKLFNGKISFPLTFGDQNAYAIVCRSLLERMSMEDRHYSTRD
ncbi:hypothetical protein [Desulfovibrio sp. JC022]|uniref:hypothetical protein n=1 Tax=Desulfovibrio sp. JC022 TaxID=2593642 RepID=UPI0013D23FC8|nr:hypothetical protein [Desulfovibrio sp. JC022]NDV21583.1 hypothetical protein [Desulfovibrio sp. JC022]